MAWVILGANAVTFVALVVLVVSLVKIIRRTARTPYADLQREVTALTERVDRLQGSLMALRRNAEVESSPGTAP